MVGELRILDTVGPLDKVLRDTEGRLRSFPEIMYECYSFDARGFVVSRLKEILDDPPQPIRNLPSSLQDKAKHLRVLEIVVKYCESAEDLAAFAIAFAAEQYMDALNREEVWKRLAEYKISEIVNFFRDIGKRPPEYFANLHGHSPLHLQKLEACAILLRSCRQLAAYLGKIADRYMKLRELQNSYKHGMRIFPAALGDNRSRQKVPAFSYIDSDTNVKATPFPRETVEEVCGLCVNIGQTLGAMLRWHSFRLRVFQGGKVSGRWLVFGQPGYQDQPIRDILFPTLFDVRKDLVAKAEMIANRKSKELSMIPAGHCIAIDIDSEEILQYHAPDFHDVTWKAIQSRLGARPVICRMTTNGKAGPY